MNDLAYGVVFGVVGGMMVNICIKVRHAGSFEGRIVNSCTKVKQTALGESAVEAFFAPSFTCVFGF